MLKRFDDFAPAHDMNRAGHIHGGVQIVGNHQKAGLELHLKLLQKIQHLLFQRDIQSAEGLVKDNVLGLGGQSASNA